MDTINDFNDDLLLQILSSVPTKTAVDAQLVSKRWFNLWKRLPSLHYDQTFHKSESQFLEFINRTMEQLETPVIESLYLSIAPTETSFGAVMRSNLLAKRPRELKLISTNWDRLVLKNGIYQCHSLVVLRLERITIEDSYHIPNILHSLRVLELRRVKYGSDEALSYLLPSLPSLQDLILDQCRSVEYTTTLSIAVPWLKRLTVLRCPDSCQNSHMVLNVDSPSLEYLNIEDCWRNVSFSDQNMDELVEAEVDVSFTDTNKLLGALMSVKRLSLCLLTSKVPRIYAVFDQLVSLEICTCQQEWWNPLEGVLLNSPKLRFLKLHQKHCFGIMDLTVRWKEPVSVPVCFAYHLEMFEWRDYEGTEAERELANYILRNAVRLKVSKFYPVISHTDGNKIHSHV